MEKKPQFGSSLNQPLAIYSEESEIWDGGTSSKRKLTNLNSMKTLKKN